MNSGHDSRRARQDGTQRIGHDPRRGASSPQWNREAQMQHEQFLRRHGSPYESPYGGQYGGYENSLEPHHGQQGGRGREYRGDFAEDWYSAEGAMEAAGSRQAQQFGGYGDYDMHEDRRRFDDRLRAQHGMPWQRQGHVPNQFSRDEQWRTSGAQGRRYDPDYEQWRHEQMQQLDDDYEAYRRERYGKFADDFNAWRAKRGPRTASSGADTDRDTDPKSGNEQQG